MEIKDKPAHIKFAPDDHIRTLRTLSRRQFIFYDVSRAWLVDGTSALLHLLRAAIEDYQGDPDLERLGLLLFDADEIEEARKTHTGRDAAFEFLANENNLAIPLYLRATEAWTEKTTKLGSREVEEVLNEKSTAFRVKDRVDQIVRFLEQIIAHQDNVHTQTGVGFRLRHTPRRQLEGFDFMDVATNSDTIWPKVTTLGKTGRGWVDFTRAIHAVTLFGTHFGDLFQPNHDGEGCSSCLWNASVPECEDHLAVCVTELRSIFKTKGNMTRRPWRLCLSLAPVLPR
ncbi:LOW QUALITY PROTEIN: hypothetical protein ColTof4_09370 [Colletotrichum tofieldiae]|nr:LOW QUALITY PROTEIN: hypothetical protein ColTof3_12657 [Colletotrichum tofieldiae]GKT76947.1 LOW QUALITY PROTEIN: hypothetical protein ColTof4_09370 [Colletotrichum tofieldiae]GKT92606.1 LOW QUALITY PROTEIN: hypothetical protein Ct61P_10456 [Colletotrichum tofieldiae]